MSNIFTVPRLDDKLLFSIVKDIIALQRPSSATALVLGARQQLDLQKDPSIQSIVKRNNSFLISNAHLYFDGFQVIYYRGGEPKSDHRPSAIYDEFIFRSVQVQQPTTALSDERRTAIAQIVSDRAGKNPTAALISSGEASGLNELEGLYRSTFLKLEQSFAEQIEKITDWTVQQTSAFEARKIELLEKQTFERQALESEFNKKQEGLATQAQELEAHKKSLDDRNNTHVRREIRRQLHDLVTLRANDFRLSRGTRKLRLPIHAAMIVLITAIGLINFHYFNLSVSDVIQQQAFVAFAVVLKQGLLAAAFVGVTLYYIRWMNRWFEEHSEAEFSVKQFQLDIDRASWVVETALEWKKEQSSEIPSTLLDGISRNLFSNKGESTERTSAADDLASALLGNASNLKLKVGDNEVNLDRRGISKLGKTEIKVEENRR